MPDYTYLRFEKTGPIGVVTLTGPNSFTVLSSSMLRELGAFFRDVRSDASLKVLIIAGEGKAFAAGADIKEMQKLSPSAAKEYSRLGNDVFDSIEHHPIPVIAAVNGFALGGGLELVLSADLAYASASARFALPEVTLGLIPGFGGCRRLSARIGMARAKELAFTGRMIGAEDASRLGIVNKVTEPEALLPAAMATAQEIAAASGNAVREVKDLLAACTDGTTEEITTLEIEKFGAVFEHQDSETGLTAFIAKSKPLWKDNK